MKRMYVTLGLILTVMIWTFSSLGQKDRTSDSTFNRSERRQQLREEMHRRMRDKLLHGIGPDQDLFQGMEQLLEDSFSDSFSAFESFGSMGANFSTEWITSDKGRTLVVTPKSENQQLDIDVNKGMITIKGKTENKTGHSTSLSSFSNSFSIPQDLDADKVQIAQKDNKILVEFPYRKEEKTISLPKKEERKPITPPKDAVEI
jgi:HSP20 family molecular chaperone IbpA